ncbi:hypothetical protein BKA63DRAFT_569217 [Paraphoma chrysanthemicola]|nr:hypothetical protein BKA63DRAFT_569217 [Paraphoma chrysanthemicola]
MPNAFLRPVADSRAEAALQMHQLTLTLQIENLKVSLAHELETLALTTIKYMYDILPRELRDLVNEHIFSGNYVPMGVGGLEDLNDVGTMASFHKPESEKPCKFRSQLVQSGCHALFEPGAIPESLAREILEIWYSCAMFRFTTVADYNRFYCLKIPGLEVTGGSLVRRVELYTYFHSQDNARSVACCVASELFRIQKVARKVNVLIVLHFDASHCGVDTGGDRSAQVPIHDVGPIFPVLRQLVEGNHVITVKLGNILNINVDVDELLVESWTTKIQDHQRY